MNSTLVTAADAGLVAAAAPHQPMKILVVDDSPDNLFSVQTALEPLGEEILLACSGKEALRLCLDNDFAVILLDVRMPDLDGFETAEYIRARERSQFTPLLFLTAYRSDEQLFRGYELGAVDFLFRPVVPEILQSKVRVFVELSRAAALLRKHAATLAKAEAKFRSVLEAAPDAMLITTPGGQIRLVNSRTEALFGYSREGLIGLNISALVPEWMAECGVELSEKNGDQGPADSGVRVRAFRRDGLEFPAEITSSPLKTEEGLLMTSAIRDVTERVQAEEAIRRINSGLEQRVAERTAELTRSNDALRQFAWAASHDLQEPIRVVVSFAEMLAEGLQEKLDAQQSRLLSRVQENGRRANALLGALRQYLHISDLADENKAERTDCNCVVRAIVEDLQDVIAQAAASITCDPLPNIAIPNVLLTQVLRNLISNALKYHGAQVPQIHISAKKAEKEWIFSVQDNGIGINKNYTAYIFGMFKRLHPNACSGAGMGLAIAKAAVERFGGRIWVESQPGEGSTFKFSVRAEEIL